MFRTTCFNFSADVIPMLTKSSLLPLVVIEPGEAGFASTRFSPTSAAASFAEWTTMALMASSTVMVWPGLRPSLTNLTLKR